MAESNNSLTLPRPPLIHISKCLILAAFQSLQGWTSLPVRSFPFQGLIREFSAGKGSIWVWVLGSCGTSHTSIGLSGINPSLAATLVSPRGVSHIPEVFPSTVRHSWGVPVLGFPVIRDSPTPSVHSQVIQAPSPTSCTDWSVGKSRGSPHPQVSSNIPTLRDGICIQDGVRGSCSIPVAVEKSGFLVGTRTGLFFRSHGCGK